MFNMELNEILIHSMLNGWGEKYFLEGLDFEAVPFKEAIDMFERTEIAERIYEDLVKDSYKNNN